MQFQWSPYGVEVRNWLDKWSVILEDEERANRIKLLIDGQNFIFFFLHNGKIYAGSENSRLTFATMKNPSDDDQAVDEMNFSATCLLDALMGRPTERIFFHKDLDIIDVIKDKEKVFDMLMSAVKGAMKQDTHDLVDKMNKHRKHQRDKEDHDKDGVSLKLHRDND